MRRRLALRRDGRAQVRLSMLYWSDSIDKDPAARAASERMFSICHKCWPKCYWVRSANWSKGIAPKFLLVDKKPLLAYCHPRFLSRASLLQMHCWSENHSLEVWRAYNYPHVTAVYWALYRLARFYNPPLAARADWKWYLEQERSLMTVFDDDHRHTASVPRCIAGGAHCCSDVGVRRTRDISVGAHGIHACPPLVFPSCASPH